MIKHYFFLACFLLLVPDLKADLQPHRAYYTLALAGRPSPQSPLVDVRGTLLIELSKAETGWTLQHLSKLSLYYVDGTVEHVRDGYVTFEAYDGNLFKFHTYRRVDDAPVETISKGVAKKKGETLEVTYTQPTKKTLVLPEGALFPLQYRQALLKAASEGEKMFPRLVFDGRNLEGASETNTFMSAQRVGESGHQLAGQAFWPMRSAIYSPKTTYYEPMCTTTQDLFATGITGPYVTDCMMGDMKIHGTLDRVELLQEAEKK